MATCFFLLPFILTEWQIRWSLASFTARFKLSPFVLILETTDHEESGWLSQATIEYSFLAKNVSTIIHCRYGTSWPLIQSCYFEKSNQDGFLVLMCVTYKSKEDASHVASILSWSFPRDSIYSVDQMRFHMDAGEMWCGRRHRLHDAPYPSALYCHVAGHRH